MANVLSGVMGAMKAAGKPRRGGQKLSAMMSGKMPMGDDMDQEMSKMQRAHRTAKSVRTKRRQRRSRAEQMPHVQGVVKAARTVLAKALGP